MTGRFKRNSWQKALSSHAILPLLSIWLDFPATTWLKSLQQQHFISAHCEIDFTRLRLYWSNVTFKALENPDESEDHLTATKDTMENEGMKVYTLLWCPRMIKEYVLYKLMTKGRCMEILHLHWTMSEMCVLHPHVTRRREQTPVTNLYYTYWRVDRIQQKHCWL